MTTDGYTNVGEEWAQKWPWRQDTLGTRDTTLEVLVYDDSTDSISENQDISDITTEPSGGSYARQTVNLDSADVTISENASGNVEINFAVTFDFTGASNTPDSADSYGAVVDFKSTVANGNAEGSQNAHLIATDTFAQGAFTVSAETAVTVNVTLSLD